VTQGKKFDENGVYVRRWVPEIAKLPDRWLHEPWNAPEDILRDAEIRLGKNYPAPMVDHAAAREEALQRFEAVKRR
jgi:deoxyribodipyrimidine photo-lyase